MQTPFARSTPNKEAGFLTSLIVWGMCSAIWWKIAGLVGYTWLYIILSFGLRRISGTLPNLYAWYMFALLIALTGILLQVRPLRRDAKQRALDLFRASITLGPA